MADAKDPCQQHAMTQVKAGKLLYCRVARTKIQTRWVFRLQMVLDGKPLMRHQAGIQKVGLDLGPSTITTVSDQGVYQEKFCAEITDQSKMIRRLQRKLDRQHRAGSKGCFDVKGRHIKGDCLWAWQSRSKRALQTQAQLAEISRRLAEHRKALHGNLANRILGQGVVIKAEKIAYKAWQKQFGRSVGRRSPGGFFSLLSRKAGNAGGAMSEINTWSTKLSQACVCSRVEKKPLSLRVHRCPSCGLVTDRDVLSSLLVKHVTTDGTVHQLDLLSAQSELSGRHDIDGWSRSGSTNLRVPPAIRLGGQGEIPGSGSAISFRITADAHLGEAA